MIYRVLAIDDNKDFLDIIAAVLRPLQCEIEVASSSTEGLQKAKAFNPDLIILDVMMPKMDGWQVLEHIREFSDVPVIMLSAATPDGEIDRTLWLKADVYLMKPIPFAKLRARVKALLQQDLGEDAR